MPYGDVNVENKAKQTKKPPPPKTKQNKTNPNTKPQNQEGAQGELSLPRNGAFSPRSRHGLTAHTDPPPAVARAGSMAAVIPQAARGAPGL